MTTAEKIAILSEKKNESLMSGGPDSADKQHKAGKLTARERAELIFDDNTFIEIGAFAQTRATDFGMQSKKVAGDGVITGYGYINGRLVYLSSQDFTVIGG